MPNNNLLASLPKILLSALLSRLLGGIPWRGLSILFASLALWYLEKPIVELAGFGEFGLGDWAKSAVEYGNIFLWTCLGCCVIGFRRLSVYAAGLAAGLIAMQFVDMEMALRSMMTEEAGGNPVAMQMIEDMLKGMTVTDEAYMLLVFLGLLFVATTFAPAKLAFWRCCQGEESREPEEEKEVV